MSRRRVIQAPPMTSLLDVLFIVVFASLVQASAAKHPPEAAVPAGPPRPAPLPPTPEAAALHKRALAQLDASVRARELVVARVAPDGTMRALATQGTEVALGLPLVESVAEPDVRLRYAGDRAADLRLCALVARRLAVPDLAGQLIVISPDLPLADLTVALAGGLRRDVERCGAEQRGLAIIVDPVIDPVVDPPEGATP